MPYTRRIVHLQRDAVTPIQILSEVGNSASRVTSCWFELLKIGGCGAGEITLKDNFVDRFGPNSLDLGEYISIEYQANDRWYLGRIESIDGDSPNGVRVQLQGMWVELTEVFPGGFTESNGGKPHRYGNSDYNPNDPDHSYQTYDSVDQPDQLVRKLHAQYIAPQTNVTLSTVDPVDPPVGLQSFVFRGEESAAEILRALATSAKDASVGVDENGGLFFLQKRANVIGTFQEGVDCEEVKFRTDSSLLVNRVLITGDYIYGINNDVGFMRYRAHWNHFTSAALYGYRTLRVFLPWIRRNHDSEAWAREFFRKYALPTTLYPIKTAPQTDLVKPWNGQLQLKAVDGSTIVIGHFERIRVQFDHSPVFDMTIGPEDIQYPDAPEDQRFEIGPVNPGDGEQPPSDDISSLGTFTGTFTSYSESVFTETLTSSGLTSGTDVTSGTDATSGASSSSGSGSASSGSESMSGSGSDSGGGSESGGGSGGGGSSGGGSESGGESSGGASSGGGSGSGGGESGSGSSGSSGSSSGSSGDACTFLYVDPTPAQVLRGEWDTRNSGGGGSGADLNDYIDDQQAESDPIDDATTYITTRTDEDDALPCAVDLRNTPSDFIEATSIEVHIRCKGYDPSSTGDQLAIRIRLSDSTGNNPLTSEEDTPNFMGTALEGGAGGWTDYVVSLTPLATIDKVDMDSATLWLYPLNNTVPTRGTTKVQVTAAKVKVCYTNQT